MISYTGQHIAQINVGAGMRCHSENSAEAVAVADWGYGMVNGLLPRTYIDTGRADGTRDTKRYGNYVRGIRGEDDGVRKEEEI